MRSLKKLQLKVLEMRIDSPNIGPDHIPLPLHWWLLVGMGFIALLMTGNLARLRRIMKIAHMPPFGLPARYLRLDFWSSQMLAKNATSARDLSHSEPIRAESSGYGPASEQVSKAIASGNDQEESNGVRSRRAPVSITRYRAANQVHMTARERNELRIVAEYVYKNDLCRLAIRQPQKSLSLDDQKRSQNPRSYKQEMEVADWGNYARYPEEATVLMLIKEKILSTRNACETSLHPHTHSLSLSPNEIVKFCENYAWTPAFDSWRMTGMMRTRRGFSYGRSYY